jgi:hypothetical protein
MVSVGVIGSSGGGRGGTMSQGFRRPAFEGKHIELRFEDDEVCIYATSVGLERLAAFCRSLLERPREGHIHLEDYDVLTRASLKGTMALFDD